MQLTAVTSAEAGMHLCTCPGRTYIGFPSESMSVRCFFRSACLTSISLSSVEMSFRLRGGKRTKYFWTGYISKDVCRQHREVVALLCSSLKPDWCNIDPPILPSVTQPNLCFHTPSETARTSLTCQPQWQHSCVVSVFVTNFYLTISTLQWLCNVSDCLVGTPLNHCCHPPVQSRRFKQCLRDCKRVAADLPLPFCRALSVMSEHIWPLNRVNGRGATIVTGVAAGVCRQKCFISAEAGRGKKKRKEDCGHSHSWQMQHGRKTILIQAI